MIFCLKMSLANKSIDFGIYGIPESILIDKDLIIIKKFIGPISIKKIIKKLKR